MILRQFSRIVFVPSTMSGLLGFPLESKNSFQLSPLIVLGLPPAGTKASEGEKGRRRWRNGEKERKEGVRVVGREKSGSK